MTKPQQSLVFKSTKPMERFSVYLPFNLEGDSASHSDSSNHEDEWMLGLTASEAKNSVFNISKENNRFFSEKLKKNIQEQPRYSSKVQKLKINISAHRI